MEQFKERIREYIGNPKEQKISVQGDASIFDIEEAVSGIEGINLDEYLLCKQGIAVSQNGKWRTIFVSKTKKIILSRMISF